MASHQEAQIQGTSQISDGHPFSLLLDQEVELTFVFWVFVFNNSSLFSGRVFGSPYLNWFEWVNILCLLIQKRNIIN